MMVKHNTRIDRLRPSDRHDAAGDRERSRTCELTARLRYVRPRSERLTSSQRYKLVRAWLSAFVRCQKVQYNAGATRVRLASLDANPTSFFPTKASESRRDVANSSEKNTTEGLHFTTRVRRFRRRFVGKCSRIVRKCVATRSFPTRREVVRRRRKSVATRRGTDEPPRSPGAAQ